MTPTTALALFNQTESETETVERVPLHLGRAILKPAPSLRPGESMMTACIAGDPEAEAIRNSWRFRFPIRTVSREEFAAMAERNGAATYVGKRSEVTSAD